MEWCYVGVKLPEEWGDVLISDGEEVLVGTYRPAKDRWETYEGVRCTTNFKYWMPLPNPPE